MIEEIIYLRSDLVTGCCSCCGEVSEEILKGDGRCIDCIETDRFYKITMGLDTDNDDTEDDEIYKEWKGVPND